MKKILLLTLFLLLLSTILVANEASIYYSSRQVDDGVGSEKYWHLRDIYLNWETKNIHTEFNITGLTNNPPQLEIPVAYIDLNLFTTFFSPFQKYEWLTANLSVGAMYYPFGNISSQPSKNLSIFQPTYELSEGVMLNMHGSYCSRYMYDLYWADDGDISGNNVVDVPSIYGFRGQYALNGLNFGASFRLREKDNEDNQIDYGTDIIFSIAKDLKLNFQLYNQGDGDDDTSDLNFFLLSSYEKGFNLPYLKKTIPYFGYFSKNNTDGDGAKEYNIVFGLNMKPHKNIFMKLEYNADSIDADATNTLNENNTNVSNAFSLELGLAF